MNNVKIVYDIMEKIKNESSKTGKSLLLTKHKDTVIFKEVLKFLLNPFIVTGISTKKMKKKVSVETNEDFSDILELLNYIKEFNSGRDYDIANVNKFIDKLESDDLKTFVKQIVTKDYKLGVSESTVNKVYGADTIPSFDVMLAEPYHKKGDKIKGEFFVTLKLDGNRCVAIKDSGKVKFFARSGKEIEGLTELSEILESGFFPNNYVFDGEVILRNVKGLKSDELFRETQKIVRKDGEKKGLEFHVFDILPLDEFKKGESLRVYKVRRAQLENLFKPLLLTDSNPLVKLLPVIYNGTDKSVIPQLLSEAEQDGQEGVMVNDANAKYVTKRTVALQKVKTMYTVDLKVVSVEIAQDGSFKGLMSRVNVEYKDGNTVGVGSGFTIVDRDKYANNPDLIIGKIIEVSYFEESQDESGKPSLRFPIFKTVRDDKGEDDVNFE